VERLSITRHLRHRPGQRCLLHGSGITWEQREPSAVGGGNAEAVRGTEDVECNAQHSTLNAQHSIGNRQSAIGNRQSSSNSPSTPREPPPARNRCFSPTVN